MILNFITENKDLISVLTVSLTGLFVFIKWIDARNRELKETRYKTYMELIGVISGKRADSTAPNLTEQVAATWFLLEYKEYYPITRKIFSESDLENMANDIWVLHVSPHVKNLLKEIS